VAIANSTPTPCSSPFPL